MENKKAAGEELSQEPILKQGMVLKRGRKVTSTWKKRYFILRFTTLSYHAGMDTENEEKRYIEITQSSTVTHRPDKHPLCFQVRTPGYRKITARCETDEELHLWMSAIEECIKRAPAWPIKCVIVGDDEEHTYGKRVMVSRYLRACKGKIEDGEAKMLNPHGYTTLNKSRTRIVKTPDELGNVDIMLEYEKGEWVKLMMWHLDGGEECTKLRNLAYPHSDIFLVVFSVSDNRSFDRVDVYMKEIKQSIQRTANGSSGGNPLFLLVGTRLSSELVAVGFNQGEEKARALGFSGYVECRTDSEEDCEQVFADAVRLVVEKSVAVYSTNDTTPTSSHNRQASGILSSLAARLRKKNTGGDSEKSQVDSGGGDNDSPDTSPTHGARKGKAGFGFFQSSEKLVNAALNRVAATSVSSKKSDLASQAESIKSLAQASAVDGEEDSDEGSLIGIEMDEADEEAKARVDRDFGLSQMKDDPNYTQKVLNRSNSRRSGEQASVASVSHRSLGLEKDKELFDIVETAAEDRERELEELRLKDAKREREIERMKLMMDSLKTYNKAVEEQLKAMREELALVNKKGISLTGEPPAMPPLATALPSLSLPPPSVPVTAQAVRSGSPSLAASKSFLDLPPRPPQEKSSSPARSAFRANRATSVFF